MSNLNHLNGKRIAILIADGFDPRETSLLREALIMAEADTELVAPAAGDIRSDHTRAVVEVYSARGLAEAGAEDFNALVIPGGTTAIEALRRYPAATAFVNRFFSEGKPIAAIGHAVTLLMHLGPLDGRSVATLPALREQVVETGATWVDGPVAVDHGLVTGHALEGHTDFNNAMVEAFATHDAGVGR